MTESTLAAVVQAATTTTLASAPTSPGSGSNPPAAQASADQIAAARAEGRVEGLAEGRSAERARISAILGSEEAKGREGLAHHFAFKSETSPDAAIEAMKASAKAEAPNVASRLDALMTDPQIGASVPQQAPEQAVSDGLAAAVDNLIKR